MPRVTHTSRRKADHIQINLEKDVRSGLTTGLEHYHFIHQALPELDLAKIDTNQELFGKTLRAPLLISSMTGGTQAATRINLRLAKAAQEMGVAMGLGSLRAALESPDLASSFQVRNVAPDILLFANLGAVQLNYGFTIEHYLRAVELIEADALFLHLNPLQEAIQVEGNTNFSGLASKIEAVCKAIRVPVIAKEVGWGISENTARMLFAAGVSAIDVAGAGGTSWSQVEMHRATDENTRQLAETFIDWGIPTAVSIQNVKRVAPGAIIFASGGLRNGLDIAKCIALGARLGGMTTPYLKAATVSTENTIQVLRLVIDQLKTTMFAAGAKDLETLGHTPLIREQ